MKNPKEQELIDQIETEQGIVKELEVQLETADKNVRRLKNELVKVRMAPIVIIK